MTHVDKSVPQLKNRRHLSREDLEWCTVYSEEDACAEIGRKITHVVLSSLRVKKKLSMDASVATCSILLYVIITKAASMDTGLTTWFWALINIGPRERRPSIIKYYYNLFFNVHLARAIYYIPPSKHLDGSFCRDFEIEIIVSIWNECAW